MKVNPAKLLDELHKAGIHAIGCNSDDGRVWDEDGNIQDRADVAAVIAAHDPTPTAQTVEVFALPIKTPMLITEEVVLQSPKPKDTPQEALARAQEILALRDKPIGEMLFNLLLVVEDLAQQVEGLKKK